VLIADDDPVARSVLSEQLRQLGHDARTAPDGRTAWDMYRESAPQLLISDWIMPGIDGPELCRWVRSEKRPAYTYIIMLTILGGKGCYLEALQSGADDFMSKPLDLEVVAARTRVAERIVSLQTEVRQLRELLPICSYCRRIRTEGWLWQRLEDFITSHTKSRFSHSICPDCFEREVKPQLDGVVGA